MLKTFLILSFPSSLYFVLCSSFYSSFSSSPGHQSGTKLLGSTPRLRDFHIVSFIKHVHFIIETTTEFLLFTVTLFQPLQLYLWNFWMIFLLVLHFQVHPLNWDYMGSSGRWKLVGSFHFLLNLYPCFISRVDTVKNHSVHDSSPPHQQ